MSLAHSHPDLSTADASVRLRFRATETRSRSLSRADTRPDEKSVPFRPSEDDENQKPPPAYTKPSGNAKMQEPQLMAPRRKGFRERKAGHSHPKPWSSSCIPGRRENPTASDQYRRTWMADGALADKVGKWNSQRLRSFYEAQDKDMMKLKPHDEIFAKNFNMKYWTHLEGSGTFHGGQHKVETRPARQTGLHLKGGLYIGKYENIKHTQLYNMTGYRHNGGEGKAQDLHKDKRPAFDNRLHDDVIAYLHKCEKEAMQANYDIFRPVHTLSCPQLGAEFTNR